MEIERIVLLIKDPYLYTRYKLTGWHLAHLLKPCTINQLDDPQFDILDIKLKDNSKKSLVEITLDTEIVTLCDRQKLVILLDTSSSTKTVEAKVLSSIAFETYF